MATAKKARKPVSKSKSRTHKARSSKNTRKPVSVKQHNLENATSPEELIAGLEAAQKEHGVEVQALGTEIFKVLKKTNFHPTVVLDTMQRILISGVGTLLGPAHEELLEKHLARFHAESRLLHVVEALGGSIEDLIAQAEAQGTEDEEISMEDVLGGKGTEPGTPNESGN